MTVQNKQPQDFDFNPFDWMLNALVPVVVSLARHVISQQEFITFLTEAVNQWNADLQVQLKALPKPKTGLPPAPPVKVAPQFEVPTQIYEFFVNNGYTSAQACGVVGNIQAESNFNPHATGDGGLAHGLCQWHPERCAAMKRGTGIDMWS